MRAGKSAPDALSALLAADDDARRAPGRDDRRAGPRRRAHGREDIAAAGHIVGTDYSVQANLMVNDKVWPAMAKAFEETKGDLAERMLAALDAAQAAGGDIRGRQSAAIIVVAGKPTGNRGGPRSSTCASTTAPSRSRSCGASSRCSAPTTT